MYNGRLVFEHLVLSTCPKFSKSKKRFWFRISLMEMEIIRFAYGRTRDYYDNNYIKRCFDIPQKPPLHPPQTHAYGAKESFDCAARLVSHQIRYSLVSNNNTAWTLVQNWTFNNLFEHYPVTPENAKIQDVGLYPKWNFWDFEYVNYNIVTNIINSQLVFPVVRLRLFYV